MKICNTIVMLCILILIAAPASAQDVVWQYDAIMPWDAGRLANNNTLITEYGNHTVIEVNTTTSEIIWQYGTAGTAGSDPGQLNSPVDAERLSGDSTLITDRNNHRVIEVNTTGAILWQYGNGTSGSGYDQLNNPMDAERLSGGNTLITDYINDRVIEVNESKGIVWQYAITNPFDADRLSNGNTLIVEYTNHRVIEINESDEIVWQYGDGTSGSGVNHLNNPMDAERLANGNTLIADYINDRVIEVRTSDYNPAEIDNGFTAASIVWEYGSNHPADAERLSGGSTLICEAGGNSVIEVGISTCWTDTFDDETKIAAMQHVVVSDGDVEIDLDNVTGIWRSSSIGQGLYGSLYDKHQGVSAIVFNLTGDGRWNAIMGRQDPGSTCSGCPLEPPHGFYWDGTQWIRDDSCIAGFPSDLSWPAIAFNITGDGRWNAIDGSQGYYWNDNEWVSDTSIVSGIDGRMTTIALNVTGDGRWNAIGYSKGYYWNDTEWVEDPRLGLGGWVQVAFNLTSDGRWNAISGTVPSSFYGSTTPNQWYWNGTGWVEEPLIGGFPKILRNKRPVIAFSIAGDGRWNVVAGISGYDMFYPADITSQVIDLHADNHWLFFFANDTTPDGTEIAYTILDEWNNTLMEVVPGQVISDVTDAKVRLFAELRVNSPFKTPVLHDWRICCVEGLPGGVLKEKKRLTFDLNSSTSPCVAADSEDNIHILWNEDRGGSQLYYKKLASNGTVLVNDKMVCSGSEPGIAVDSSCNVHVTFNNVTNVSYMKLDNIGNILVAPKQVIGVYYWGAKAGGIAVDRNGNVHIVGCSRCGMLPASSTQEITYVQLDNNGNELVNYTIDSISSHWYGTWDCMNAPSGIAVDSDGNAYTAYSKGSGNCGGSPCGGFTCTWPTCAKVWYAKIDGDGVHKQELTGDLPLPSLYPSVCVDSGDNAYVIWSQHNGSGSGGTECLQGGGFDFYLTKFDKSGNRVVNSKRLTYEDYPPQGYWDPASCCQVPGVPHPIINTESGIMHTVFSRESKIYYMAFDASGGVVTDRMLLSPPSAETTAKSPSIDAVSDGSHIVWDERREHDPASEIYSARLVLPPNSVFLMPPPGRWTAIGVNATYAIGILSTMPGTETFDLGLDNLDGVDVAELSNYTITLDPFVTGEVTLDVTDADVGDYRVTVSATSQTNPEINASATITTSVIVPEPDLLVTAMDAYHNDTGYPPYFNLSNEVDVEVENTGTEDAGAFNVSLYADGELVDKQTIPDLGYGSSTTVQFKWTPTGLDCEDGGSQQTYTLKAIADCDNDLVESDEANNEATTQETVYWAGYSADEPINAIAWHGMLHGGLHYTTGDGSYTGLYTPGNSEDTHYSITLPAGASIELARLNVYYTWSNVGATGVYPVMEVRITNTTGTYLVPINASYNDRPCDSPAIGYEYPFGNYAYDLTPYITGDGSYTVNVKNTGPSGYSFCIAAPGLVILYGDETKPEYEFWILEGADLLEGGRRGGAGNLDLSECISNATFTGDIDTDKVDHATLGIVSAWGGAAWGEDWTSYYWFNENYLCDGSMLGGYGSLYDRTICGISMYAGASGNAQVGVNVSDVTLYITGDNNTLSFGDDGDSMMAANAFLVVEHGAGRPPAPLLISGWVNYPDGGPAHDSDVVITNLNTSEVFAVETVTDSNYYQVMTCSYNVSAGDVLNFNASNGDSTELNHTVTIEEMNAGGFEQDMTVGRSGICGDVTGNNVVNTGDVILLSNYVGYTGYTLPNEWAGDVTGNGVINTGDVILLSNFVGYTGYSLNCTG